MTTPDFPEDQRFRKAERLRKRAEFLETQRKGKRVAGAHFIVYARANAHAWSRLGITASRKVGDAVTRNWWKRRVREIFRRHKAQIPQGMDFVVIVKVVSARPDFERMRTELLGLLERAAPARRPAEAQPR